MELALDEETQKQDVPVLAEIPISSTNLHQIANGRLCTVGYEGQSLAVRFLLKNSFKVKASNHVVNQLVMQVVAVGLNNVMRKEEIATQVKVKQVIKEKEVVKKPSVDFKIDNKQKELW